MHRAWTQARERREAEGAGALGLWGPAWWSCVLAPVPSPGELCLFQGLAEGRKGHQKGPPVSQDTDHLLSNTLSLETERI